MNDADELTIWKQRSRAWENRARKSLRAIDKINDRLAQVEAALARNNTKQASKLLELLIQENQH